ncbi:hypothetical protein LCGC14_2630060, partial [marine sediment metagenome]
MAIDTNEKLLSMLNFGDGTVLHVLPEADAAIGADDRLHLLDLYSGIAAAAPPVVARRFFSLNVWNGSE